MAMVAELDDAAVDAVRAERSVVAVGPAGDKSVAGLPVHMEVEPAVVPCEELEPGGRRRSEARDVGRGGQEAIVDARGPDAGGAPVAQGLGPAVVLEVAPGVEGLVLRVSGKGKSTWLRRSVARRDGRVGRVRRTRRR